jgi:hypothetical protein
VEEALFEALVLDKVSLRPKKRDDYYPQIRVVPSAPDGSGETLYTHSLADRLQSWTPVELDSMTDLRFMGFFDWNMTSDRDFRYVAARIVESNQHGIAVGGGVLIPASRAITLIDFQQ